jgi:hypothetical protein
MALTLESAAHHEGARLTKQDTKKEKYLKNDFASDPLTLGVKAQACRS